MEKKIAAENTIKRAERIWELDVLRGICVALMILDHLLFDLGFVFLQSWFPQGGEGIIYIICDFARNFYWEHPVRLIFHYAVVAGFIFSCGISCSFSRSNFRRGAKLLLIALLLSACTFAMDKIFHTESFFIKFGILHMLALSILLYELTTKIHRFFPLIFGIVIIIISFIIDPDTNQIEGFLPFALGISDNTWSADYFPIIPWTGWMLIGGVLGGLLYAKKRTLFPGHGHGKLWRPFSWLGNHALLLYVLHQPLIYGLLLGLGAIFA